MAKGRSKKTQQKYWQAVRKVSKAVGRSVAEVRGAFSGNTNELYRVSSKQRIKTSYTVFRKKKRVTELVRELSLPESVEGFDLAENYYNTIEKISKTRIERIVYAKGKPPRKFVKKFGRESIERFSREITRGKEKGKLVFYHDTSFDTPLDKQAAFLLKGENRVARIATDFLDYTWNQYRAFWKYFEARDLKAIRARSPKVPTFAEAMRAAERLNEALKDTKVFEMYVNIFGHSP